MHWLRRSLQSIHLCVFISFRVDVDAFIASILIKIPFFKNKNKKINNSFFLRCGSAVPRLWIPSDSQLTVCDSCGKVLFRRPADMLINFRCARPDWLVVRVRDVRAARLFKLIRCVRSKKAAHQSAACDARSCTHSLALGSPSSSPPLSPPAQCPHEETVKC